MRLLTNTKMIRLPHIVLTRAGLAVFAALLGSLAVAGSVKAFSASSTNYTINDAAINSFGGSASSTNYSLTDSGGEPFIGQGSSTNYRLNAGYVAQLEQSISLSLNALSVTIPTVTPGTSQNATTVVSVQTDAAGYLLAVRTDQLLTRTTDTTTISAVSGTIASPAAWVEGTTKGFGFTISAGTSVESKWGTNPNYNYAAFPFSDTTIHDKPNYQNAADATTIQYRLDVNATQPAGTYRANVTYSATIKP